LSDDIDVAWLPGKRSLWLVVYFTQREKMRRRMVMLLQPPQNRDRRASLVATVSQWPGGERPSRKLVCRSKRKNVPSGQILPGNNCRARRCHPAETSSIYL
jgi:hypothetical protein